MIDKNCTNLNSSRCVFFKIILQLVLVVLMAIVTIQPSFCREGYDLVPISGADGLFDVITINNQTVYRSKTRESGFQYYMYFTSNQLTQFRNKTVYLEIKYLDLGYGRIGVDYNSSNSPYERAAFGYNNFHLGKGIERKAVFELQNVFFNHSQNLGADLRLFSFENVQMHIISVTAYFEPTELFLEYSEDYKSPYKGKLYTGDNLVDNSTINGKVICGYQGWFRTPGDPTSQGWIHYFRDNSYKPVFEMWPDMLEFTASEKYPVPDWKHEDGSQAYLFSSANRKTLNRHIQWMEAYDIDAFAVSRFVSGISTLSNESFRILSYCRDAANMTGRTFFIFYDMTGVKPDEAFNLISKEWRFLVDSMKITSDDRYLHHNGKPVIGVYGFFEDRFSASDGNKILDIFQNEGSYSAFVMGSGQWWWNIESSAAWKQMMRRMDSWVPWNVGNYTAEKYARTDYWAIDKTAFASSGTIFLPLAYPGSSWDNLQNWAPGTSHKIGGSRLKGEFMWKQMLDAKNIGAPSVFVAMFDEIDEGTAIFKVTNDIPVNHYFIDHEGLPSDFYLSLTGYAGKLIRGKESVPTSMPDFSKFSQPSIPDILFPSLGDTLTSNEKIIWSAASHESGIKSYELEINNKIISINDTIASVDLEEKTNTLRVRAINKINNRGGWSLPVTVNMEKGVTTNIKEQSLSGKTIKVVIFPNPSEKIINCVSIEPLDQVTINIYDINGQLLFKRYFDSFTSMNYSLIGAPGLYLFELVTKEGERELVKVVKTSADK